MGSGSESQNLSEENMESNPSAESGCESSTYSWREKRQSIWPIEIGKRRRLRSRTKSTPRDYQSASDAHHTRFCRNKRKHKINKMVRTRKQSESRRVTNFLEKRDSSCASTSSFDSSSDPKSSDGESSSSSSSRLEGSDMGTSSEQHKSHLLDMEENGGDNKGRKMDKANECNASSWKTEDMRNQSITENGESWWNEILASRSMSRELAEECKNSVASATWMGYTDDLAKKMLGCVCRLEKQRNESFFIENRQICHFLPNIRIIRKITLGEHIDLNSVLIIQEIGMQKEKEQEDMWNPQQLFTYIETIGKNENMSFAQLTRKTVCLCMLFSACRFTEFERINLKESEIDKQSINLNASLKTGLDRSNIVIPFLSKESLICPTTAVKDLCDRVKIHNPTAKKLFLSSSTYDPMKARAIRKVASEMMKDARVFSNNSPNTLKHASISAFVMEGTPVEQVAKFARLSPRSNTVIKHYFKSNISNKMSQIISSNQETKEAIQQPSTVPPSASTQDEKDSIITINQQSRLPEGHETVKAREEISQPDRIEEPDDDKSQSIHEKQENTTNNVNEKNENEIIEEKCIQFIIRTRSQRRKEMVERDNSERNP
ncbi:uncharacterized protein MONOS_9770 [Monocercomonoides exilis]|uniref:uncharacterized protein n=1 Tax=Monocercomonoides exilis TaxID=2049356 RepID=UPI00355A89C7|nr:hypothetical protein MONOS_9770 [Monocercomonoides exilis]|eukprot:MONOS_9770.1-p1 / transcript=MONOS_9770.1 / gene=MONOS_9770 / organism=Monocercomonoides_exilis_PA203 / gene_product=unspecified product / transcript_product=unspecified product / location=Mono_scaffold00416:25865-27741(-) / protein_length=603 / sequence_SO=supercontig / SO=protein_coding / is_pseudo=false